MKLIKKINNNFAVAFDSKGEQVIVEGRGIGFRKMPCDLTDLSILSRTYYDYDERYLDLLSQIPMEIIEVANDIHKYLLARVNCFVNQNLSFTLADHINFSIQRFQKNILVKLPVYYDLLQMYPIECETAEYALRQIRLRLSISLPPDEKAGIVLNLINAETDDLKTKTLKENEQLIDKIVQLVESNMGIQVSRDSFNFSRFQTHINYMLKRLNDHNLISSENQKMYHTLIEQFPKTYSCVEKNSVFLDQTENAKLSEEEKLYLILHVNRLCNRELGL